MLLGNFDFFDWFAWLTLLHELQFNAYDLMAFLIFALSLIG